MKQKNKPSLNLYIALSSLFVAALIVCNLIANKFISIDLGFKTFIISAGVLPYPLTFLITDILSETFGKKLTTKVVITGFISSIVVLIILWLGNQFNAIENSPVSDQSYEMIFQNSYRVIFASMAAYLSAQMIDVKIFHYWKRKTNGKHLWLRNNLSTVFSQLVDTTLVVVVLFAGVLETSIMIEYIIDGWLFKVLCALVDTPIFYFAVASIRKHFGLAINEEIGITAD
jgi:queuosine precursor transporter